MLPCAVIAVMAARMLMQDHELVQTRLADERRRIVAETRHMLLDRVERARAASAGAAMVSGRGLPPEVVFTTAIEGAGMVLPWQGSHQRAVSTPRLADSRFHEAIARGERREFSANDPAAAAASYLDATTVAFQADQRAWAQVLAARAFIKAARPAEAKAIAHRLLDEPYTLTDDQGIPFAVYAARMFSQSADATPADHANAVAALRGVVSSPTIGPAAVYMVRDTAKTLPNGDSIAGAIESRLRDLEQILSLQAALPTLGIAGGSDEAEPTWVRFGPADSLWLLRVATEDKARVITAVRAAPLFAAVQASALATVGATAEGDSLSPTFPGLRATVSPAALTLLADESNRQRPFYLGAIALVVSVAVFAGALFWRDVRRDLHIAELRSQFVSSVSHELKTPLTAIRMFAETLLMDRAAPEVRREYLETIVNESERLTRLLNNVLDFSSIESGHKTYQLQPQSLASIVRAAAKAMEYPLSQQGFELRLAVDDNAPAVAADADAIQQAIVNLLSNAVKYSGDARVIDLELTTAGDEVVIAVTDRGVGIAAAEHARIFEKYYRVHDVVTQRVPGTGLGLTLVAHVARGHGGRVAIRSAPEQGSTFALAIPIAPPQAGAIAAETPA